MFILHQSYLAIQTIKSGPKNLNKELLRHRVFDMIISMIIIL